MRKGRMVAGERTKFSSLTFKSSLWKSELCNNLPLSSACIKERSAVDRCGAVWLLRFPFPSHCLPFYWFGLSCISFAAFNNKLNVYQVANTKLSPQEVSQIQPGAWSYVAHLMDPISQAGSIHSFNGEKVVATFILPKCLAVCKILRVIFLRDIGVHGLDIFFFSFLVRRVEI